MSRIAKSIVKIPEKVEFKLSEGLYKFAGPAGKIEFNSLKGVEVANENGICKFNADDVCSMELGTFVSQFRNCLVGVSTGFSKKITLVGVGYKVIKKEGDLEFNLGYSHPVIFKAEGDVILEVQNPTTLIIKSCDKQLLGQVCANIIKLKKYDPYKGKGIILEGKFYKRKEGKKK